MECLMFVNVKKSGKEVSGINIRDYLVKINIENELFLKIIQENTSNNITFSTWEEIDRIFDFKKMDDIIISIEVNSGNLHFIKFVEAINNFLNNYSSYKTKVYIST